MYYNNLSFHLVYQSNNHLDNILFLFTYILSNKLSLLWIVLSILISLESLLVSHVPVVGVVHPGLLLLHRELLMCVHLLVLRHLSVSINQNILLLKDSLALILPM